MSLVDLAEMFGFPQNLRETQQSPQMCDINKSLDALMSSDYFKNCVEHMQQSSRCRPSRPNLDMYKNADGVEVKVDIAGYEKSDITISVEQKVLTISGERKMIDDPKIEFYCRERTQTTFSRKVTLPYSADPKTVKAQYENGILTVYVPQPEITKRTPIKIE